MAVAATPSTHMATINPCLSSSNKVFMSSIARFNTESKEVSWTRLKSSSHITSKLPFSRSLTSVPVTYKRVVTRAMSAPNEDKPLPGLPIDLRGYVSSFILHILKEF